jgi:hypothetical protein
MSPTKPELPAASADAELGASAIDASVDAAPTAPSDSGVSTAPARRHRRRRGHRSTTDAPTFETFDEF